MRKELQDRLDKIRKAQNMVAASDYIQVQMSDLYDLNPGVRATLTTIAFMQATKVNPNYPEDSPFREDQLGWCYASQAYLAKRVGKSERQVRRDIARFKRDGVVKVRQWRDSNKALHDEYHVDEDVVQKRQRKEDEPRPARSSRDYSAHENKGAFKKGEDARRNHGTSHAEAQDISRRDHRTCDAETMGHLSRGVLRETSHEGVDLQGVAFSPFPQDEEQFVPAPPGLQAAALDGKKNIEPSKGSWADRNRPEGAVTKGERKPLPNRLCYPELYAAWKKRGGRIPSCKRCKHILHWEEHHDCPGFRFGELDEGYLPIAPAGTEAFEPRKRTYQTFDEPEEDDLSGYEDWDDDHLARAATREEL